VVRRLGSVPEAFASRYHDNPKLRRRAAGLHAQASRRAAVVLNASVRLAQLDRESGGRGIVVPLSADGFPAPDPTEAITAVSLGYLGKRTDWTLLRDLAVRMPELTVLLIGGWSEDEMRDDPDFAACRKLPNLIWLGRRTDEEAARLIQRADVGLVPLYRDAYNDAALPHRILKYARQGRLSLTPELRGVRTWERAAIVCRTTDDWVEALRSKAGCEPDLGLRAWALEQTAASYNQPLWARLNGSRR
jgi:hypothetical protein